MYLKILGWSVSWKLKRKLAPLPKNVYRHYQASVQNPPNTCPSSSFTTRKVVSFSLHWVKKVMRLHPSSSNLNSLCQLLVLRYPGRNLIKFEIYMSFKIPLFLLPLSGMYCNKTFYWGLFAFFGTTSLFVCIRFIMVFLLLRCCKNPLMTLFFIL